MLQKTPTNEVWKDIPNYTGIYQVSNLGRVRSLDRLVYYPKILKYRKRKGIVLTPKIITNGYLAVELCSKAFLVHRLVANTFIENPQSLPDVNHKNGIKSNNWENNLEWVSKKDNIIHAHITGLKNSNFETHKGAKKVIDTSNNKIYDTITAAAKALGISKHLMSVWLSGRQTNFSTFKFYNDANPSK
jgi:hypothetical protein